MLLLCLAGVPDLPEGALTAIDDTTAELPDAALTLLLDDAGRWEGDSEPGATVAGFDAIGAQPAAARGERFLIEGALVTIGPEHLFGTSTNPYDKIRPWYVNTERGGVVIVYLADPPPVDTRGEMQNQLVPRHKDRPVRIVARFFKLAPQANLDGEIIAYPVFVGRTARFTGDGSAVGWGVATPVVVLLIILMFGAYFVLRIALGRASGRRYAGGQMREPDAAVDNRTDLPDDPAEALDALEHEKQADQARVVNPLEAAAEQNRE